MPKFDQLIHHKNTERWLKTPLNLIINEVWQPIANVDFHENPKKQPSPLFDPTQSVRLIFNQGIFNQTYFDEHYLAPKSLLLEGVTIEETQNKFKLVFSGTIDPVIVIDLSNQNTTISNAFISTEMDIVFKENSHAHILLIDSNDEQSSELKKLVMPSFKITLMKGTTCSLTSYINQDNQSFYLSEMVVDQHVASEFTYVNYQCGGQIIRSDLKINLQDQSASSHIYGLNIAQQDQHLSNVIDINHHIGGCYSEQKVKSLIYDQAAVVFDSQIYVNQDAQKTQAKQLAQSLLLGEQAQVITIPRLEIYADDVQCNHGATVSSLEDEHLFYLRSRGIDFTEAQQMLKRAFIQEILSFIKHKTIKDFIDSQLVTP